MPSHRTAIRQYVKALLTDKTIAGSRIFTNRAKPLGEEDMPALLIYTSTDKRGRPGDEHDGSMTYRKLDVIVEGAIENSRDIDLETVLEKMSDDIETAINDDETLGNLVIECRWTCTEIDIVPDARRLFGAVRVEFEAELYTHHDADASWIDTGITELPTEVIIREPDGPSLPPTIALHDPEWADKPIPQLPEDIDATFMHGVSGATLK